MKKIILVLTIVALLCFTLVGCSGAATPIMAWADKEILTYNVQKTTTSETIGTMTVTTTRYNPNEPAVLNDVTYTANSKTVIQLDTTDVSYTTTILSSAYTFVALSKSYTDKNNADNNYTLNAYQSGKNYVYSINGGENKKLNTGKTNFTASEFIYQYIRCYDVSKTVPTSLKIADAKTNTVISVSCANSGTTGTVDGIAFPDGTKNVACPIITVSLSDTPVGDKIYVYFTPDEAAYTASGLSFTASKKMPAKIVENDVTYILTSIKADIND